MCHDNEYEDLEDDYNKLLAKYRKSEEDNQELAETCRGLREALSEEVAKYDRLKVLIIGDLEYENSKRDWKRICREVTLEFRIFDRRWWSFFLDYLKILLGRY